MSSKVWLISDNLAIIFFSSEECIKTSSTSHPFLACINLSVSIRGISPPDHVLEKPAAIRTKALSVLTLVWDYIVAQRILVLLARTVAPPRKQFVPTWTPVKFVRNSKEPVGRTRGEFLLEAGKWVV